MTTMADFAGLSGLDSMRALVAGRFGGPSIGHTLGFKLIEVNEGHAVFEGEPSDHILNPMGIVHGGWALTLVDSACGCATHTTLAPNIFYTTLETKVNFVRAIQANTGRVRAEGRVVAQGRTIITSEAKLMDAKGKLLAHGTSTCMVLRPDKTETGS
jgi:uncharacterized protein (TIGR00369 family)